MATSQSSSSVYSTTVPSQLRPVAHCLSRLHLTTCCTIVTQEAGDQEKEIIIIWAAYLRYIY